MLFDTGLTEKEIARAEKRYKIKFPPDLREYLSYKLPIGDDFPNWRKRWSLNRSIKQRLNRPIEGILFDVEQDGFWWDKWGERPASVKKALSVAKKELEKAPKLIPICSHRFIPMVPHESGLPVLSVHQTDIIVYYKNFDTLVTNYFEHHETLDDGYEPIEDPDVLRRIPFWGALTYWNQWGRQPDWDPGLKPDHFDEPEEGTEYEAHQNRKS